MEDSPSGYLTYLTDNYSTTMKYVIIIPDGAADEPIAELDGRTILEAAKTPNLDKIAAAGQIGTASNVPDGLPAGSDVANMSVLGCNPTLYYTGRAPLEAAAQGINLGPNDWAVRCNMVTLADQKMSSFTAGHISTQESAQLLKSLQEAIAGRYPDGAVEFFPGVSYRNLLILRDVAGFNPPLGKGTRTFPPHDYSDKKILDVYPQGQGGDLLLDLMDLSASVFVNHPVSVKRRSEGKPAPTNVWLWGQGKMPQLPKFMDRFGKTGTMITAVDLLRGIGTALGFEIANVEGATGFIDTNYTGKAQACLDALKKTDLVCIHIEAPDESGHEGSVAHKLQSMEDIDSKVIGPIWDALPSFGSFRMFITPDHPTPIRTKTHSYGVVPWVMAGTGIPASNAAAYNETEAAAAKQYFPYGWELMEKLIRE